MAVTIDVFGSRVSRDLFRYVQSGKYQYRRCITGIPITTLYEKALNFQQDHFNGVGLDEYEQAVLKLQTMKIVPHILKKKKSDYLIIDLADELLKRFELISSDGINQLAYPEEKEEEYEAFLKKEKAYTLTKKYLPTEIEQRLIERKYKQFASELLYSKDNPDGYRPEQIIILEALYAGDILTNEGAIKQHDKKYRIKESNDWLRKLYAMLYKYLPECKVIKLPDFTHTSPNHLNGVHPLHYTQDTYTYIERAMDVICRYSNANTLENLRKEQSLKNKIETRVANMAFVYGLQKQNQDLQKQLQDLKKTLDTLCKKGGVTAKHDEEEITLVDTFGSCVSRDVFRFDKDHRYKVNVSIQRNPITCMFQKKLVYEKKLKGATLAYERKMLDMQFEQSAINRLKKSSSDILVMDLGEERLARYLFEYKGNEFCYATTSRVDQLYQELFEDKDVALKKKILPFEIDEEILKERLAKFVKCIVRSESNPDGYEEKNIYVLESLYAEKIISNKGWIRNYAEDYHVKQQNDMYKKMYAILYALMPRCNVIKLPQFTYSSENHMWGGHPLHYTNETYEYILDVLDVCIRHSMSSRPDKIYQERSLKNRMYTRILNGTDLYKIKTLEQKLNQIEVQLQEMEANGK